MASRWLGEISGIIGINGGIENGGVQHEKAAWRVSAA
jgi:hypothetical protein